MNRSPACLKREEKSSDNGTVINSKWVTKNPLE